MNGLECGRIADSYFCGRDADDRTIYLVHRVDVEHSTTSDHREFKSKIRETGMPRSRYLIQRITKGIVE